MAYKYTDALFRRGIQLSSTPEGKIRVFPPGSLSAKQQQVVRDNKTEIIAELEAAFLENSDIYERKCEMLNKGFDAGKLTDEARDAHMLRLARSFVVSQADREACDCGETLFWRYQGEDVSMPLMCYSCQPPPDGVVPQMYACRESN